MSVEACIAHDALCFYSHELEALHTKGASAQARIRRVNVSEISSEEMMVRGVAECSHVGDTVSMTKHLLRQEPSLVVARSSGCSVAVCAATCSSASEPVGVRVTSLGAASVIVRM